MQLDVVGVHREMLPQIGEIETGRLLEAEVVLEHQPVIEAVRDNVIENREVRLVAGGHGLAEQSRFRIGRQAIGLGSLGVHRVDDLERQSEVVQLLK